MGKRIAKRANMIKSATKINRLSRTLTLGEGTISFPATYYYAQNGRPVLCSGFVREFLFSYPRRIKVTISRRKIRKDIKQLRFERYGRYSFNQQPENWTRGTTELANRLLRRYKFERFWLTIEPYE